jgi:hypothetical protein
VKAERGQEEKFADMVVAGRLPCPESCAGNTIPALIDKFSWPYRASSFTDSNSKVVISLKEIGV